jgi:hypothetical protein
MLSACAGRFGATTPVGRAFNRHVFGHSDINRPRMHPRSVRFPVTRRLTQQSRQSRPGGPKTSGFAFTPYDAGLGATSCWGCRTGVQAKRPKSDHASIRPRSVALVRIMSCGPQPLDASAFQKLWRLCPCQAPFRLLDRSSEHLCRYCTSRSHKHHPRS